MIELDELDELGTKGESAVEEFKKHFEYLLNNTPPTSTYEEIVIQYSQAEPYIRTLSIQEVYDIIKEL